MLAFYPINERTCCARCEAPRVTGVNQDGDFICCAACLFYPNGCRCRFGESPNVANEDLSASVYYEPRIIVTDLSLPTAPIDEAAPAIAYDDCPF